jgi:lipopolysaccharide export system protein LptA
MARAEGNVIVDARWQEPDAKTLRATSRSADYVRAQDEVTLRGDVRGTLTPSDSSAPTRFSGESILVNLKTRELTMNGQPAQVRVTPKKKG